jgi:hypothetical protein
LKKTDCGSALRLGTGKRQDWRLMALDGIRPLRLCWQPIPVPGEIRLGRVFVCLLFDRLTWSLVDSCCRCGGGIGGNDSLPICSSGNRAASGGVSNDEYRAENDDHD